MVNLVSKAAIIGTVCVGVLYQFFFKSLVFHVLGFGRDVRSIENFPKFQCEKVDNLGLEGCEDMWLHEKTGYLYMACSNAASRTRWLPAIDHLNASGRSFTDRVGVLDTRSSGSVASRLKWISPDNFPGINGDKTINLHGLDVRADHNTDTLRLLLVNHRPPISATGELLDATVHGANSTIEQFLTKAGSATMRHVRTFADPVIDTPNRVAWVNEDSFVFTNDHSNKLGRRRSLDAFVGGGSVAYCSRNRCNDASRDFGFKIPNGLVHGRDGLIYVPNSFKPEINVFLLNQNHLVEHVTTIATPYPMDNLSVDKNGDIFAASFPQIYKWQKSSKKPFQVNPPAAVLRIRRVGTDGKLYHGRGREGAKGTEDAKYEVTKVMEDDGSLLPGATVVVHDALTGRYFMGGAVSPFIAICETKSLGH